MHSIKIILKGCLNPLKIGSCCYTVELNNNKDNIIVLSEETGNEVKDYKSKINILDINEVFVARHDRGTIVSGYIEPTDSLIDAAVAVDYNRGDDNTLYVGLLKPSHEKRNYLFKDGSFTIINL